MVSHKLNRIMWVLFILWPIAPRVIQCDPKSIPAQICPSGHVCKPGYVSCPTDNNHCICPEIGTRNTAIKAIKHGNPVIRSQEDEKRYQNFRNTGITFNLNGNRISRNVSRFVTLKNNCHNTQWLIFDGKTTGSNTFDTALGREGTSRDWLLQQFKENEIPWINPMKKNNNQPAQFNVQIKSGETRTFGIPNHDSIGYSWPPSISWFGNECTTVNDSASVEKRESGITCKKCGHIKNNNKIKWAFEKIKPYSYEVRYSISNKEAYCNPMSMTPVYEDESENSKSLAGMCYTAFCSINKGLVDIASPSWLGKKGALLGGCARCTSNGKSADHPDCLFLCCPQIWSSNGIAAWKKFLGQNGDLPHEYQNFSANNGDRIILIPYPNAKKTYSIPISPQFADCLSDDPHNVVALSGHLGSARHIQSFYDDYNHMNKNLFNNDSLWNGSIKNCKRGWKIDSVVCRAQRIQNNPNINKYIGVILDDVLGCPNAFAYEENFQQSHFNCHNDDNAPFTLLVQTCPQEEDNPGKLDIQKHFGFRIPSKLVWNSKCLPETEDEDCIDVPKMSNSIENNIENNIVHCDPKTSPPQYCPTGKVCTEIKEKEPHLCNDNYCIC